MLTSVSITAVTQDDLPEVARVHVASWQQTYVGLVPQDYLDSLNAEARLQKWREHFEQSRNDELFGLLVAQVGGRPVGFISFGRGHDEDRHAYPEIYSIYVLKEHWACGIGYRLYQKALESFRKRGFLIAYLWVLDTNRNAIMAYLRWGGRIEEGCLKNHVIGGQPVREQLVIFDVG